MDFIEIDDDEPFGCFLKYSLDQVAGNPLLAADVPPEDVRPMLMQAAVVQSALAANLAAISPDLGSKPEDTEDHLLTAEEAAAILNVKPRWLYARAKKLPFSRRISRKCLRFSKIGISRYLSREAKGR